MVNTVTRFKNVTAGFDQRSRPFQVYTRYTRTENYGALWAPLMAVTLYSNRCKFITASLPKRFSKAVKILKKPLSEAKSPPGSGSGVI